MKKIILLIVFISILFSCSEKQNLIYYEYNGLTVTRISDYPKDYFFIGKLKSLSDTLNKTYIKSSFSGFNSGMDAYMVFKPNGKIDIIRLDADFEKHGINDSINLKKFQNNIDFIKWEDSIKKSFKNIVRLSDGIELEKKRKYTSEVLINYVE